MKLKPYFFYFKKISIILIVSLFIISLFSINLPNVKGDVLSVTSTGVPVSNVNTNVGTTIGLNGYDVFATDTNILIYSGNGSVLALNIALPLTGITTWSGYEPTTKIMQLNATAFLAVTVGDYYTSTGGAHRGLTFDTFVFDTSTGLNSTSSSSGVDVQTGFDINLCYNTIVLFESQSGIYYCIASMQMRDLASVWHYFTDIVKINLHPLSLSIITPSFDSLYTMLYDASFWFTSQTALNTVYIVTGNFTKNTGFVVYKVNPVTPSITEVFSYADDYDDNNVWFVDYGYNTALASTNAFYDVAFCHGDTTAKQIDVDMLRFNDTNFFSDYTSGLPDNNMFSTARVIGCVPLINMWGNSLNPTLYNSLGDLNGGGDDGYDVKVTPVYFGQLGLAYSFQWFMENLNSSSPNVYIGYSGAGIYNFNNGLNDVAFANSNDNGAILSPYGYGTELQIDYQNNQVCGDYQESSNPSTGLYLQWDVTPVNAQKTIILPFTYGSYQLSQNYTYTIHASILISGVTQQQGIYSIYSNGENTNSVFGRSFTDGITVSAPMNNGLILIYPTFTNTMTTTPTYEVYQVNVTVNSYTYSFSLAFTWYFCDTLGSTLPIGYVGESGGGSYNGTNPTGGSFGNGGGTSSITPILLSIFGNVKTDIIFVIFGIICGLLTWKFALTGLVAGIGISTFLCVMAGLLSIWAIGLCVILDITLIVLGSGLLNRNGENKGN